VTIEVVSDTLFVNVNKLPKLRGRPFAFVALFLFFVSISEAQVTNPRGCPQLKPSRTTFLADNGQKPGGPFTSTERTGLVPVSANVGLNNLGLNPLHLCAETFDPNYPTNGSTAPGYSAANVDAIISETGSSDLYLITIIGNGDYYAT
jgi:hypothetical protein